MTAHNADKKSRRWFRIGYSFQQLDCDLSAGIEKVLAPCKRRSIDGQNIYFGDIHIHTGQTCSLKGKGCGRKTVEENLRYARDVSGLDFCAITDHDWQLDAYDWYMVRKANECFNRPGRFVTIHAYEWTSGNYGHRNVYFRDNDIPAELAPFDFQVVGHKLTKYGRATSNDPTPIKLWEWLDNCGLTAMTIPHHPNAEQFPMDFFRFFNKKYDRCVEVYSNWGSFLDTDKELNLCCDRIPELAYERYAGKLHFGFLASSDGHDGNAGDANVTKAMRQMAHYWGSGRVAVCADALDRQSIYDAIHDRRCYAVTGAPILLNINVNGAVMGAEIHDKADFLSVKIHAIGADPIQIVRIYRNTEIIYCEKDMDSLEFSQSLEFDAVNASYYVEIIQSDGERAWSSPIFYHPEA